MSNVENVPGLSLYCSRMKGEQKGSDSREKSQKNEIVPECSSLSFNKYHKKEGINLGNNTISIAYSRKPNIKVSKTIRKNGGTQEQGGTNSQPQNHSDSRLNDPTFKAAVRLVLESLGLESNLGNFRKYDSRYGGLISDWLAFAERISLPRMTAEVSLRGGRGDVLLCVDLPGSTRQEARGKLDEEVYEFRRWL